MSKGQGFYGPFDNEYGQDGYEWWDEGVPDAVKQNVFQSCGRDKEKLLEKEKYLDFQDYIAIIQTNWNLFKGPLGYSNAPRYATTHLAWLRKITDIQNLVNQGKKVTPAQFNELTRYLGWLSSCLSQKEI
jgi:hypothetical protein